MKQNGILYKSGQISSTREFIIYYAWLGTATIKFCGWVYIKYHLDARQSLSTEKGLS
jgi:hypothetical protein